MQVAPSFFDSPASSSAEFMQSGQDAAERPFVTIVFCSPARPTWQMSLDVPDHKSSLSTFRSCVRTTLMLLGGVECQEKEGS